MRFGSPEARALRPDGRGELPLGCRRGRRCPHRGRSGDHAGGRAGRPQRRRGQRVGLPCRGPLGGAPVPGTRLLVLAVAYPAAQPDEGPRRRGRGLPVAIADPGIRDPASGGTGAGQYPHAAPAESAFPGASGAAARLVGQRAAVALGPVTASPPSHARQLAHAAHTLATRRPRQRLIVPGPSSVAWPRRSYLGDTARVPGIVSANGLGTGRP
jgi:hypothetical protein